MPSVVDALLSYAGETLLPDVLQKTDYWQAMDRGDLSLAHGIEAEALFRLGLALGLELGRL